MALTLQTKRKQDRCEQFDRGRDFIRSGVCERLLLLGCDGVFVASLLARGRFACCLRIVLGHNDNGRAVHGLPRLLKWLYCNCYEVQSAVA